MVRSVIGNEQLNQTEHPLSVNYNDHSYMGTSNSSAHTKIIRTDSTANSATIDTIMSIEGN